MSSDDDDLDIAYAVSRELEIPSKNASKDNYIPISSDEDSGDDLDCITPHSRSLPAQYTLTDEGDEEEDAESVQVKQVVRTVKHEYGNGDRVLWSEDGDENGYEEWKRKKLGARGKKRKSAATANTTGSVAGKKIKTEHTQCKVSGRKGQGKVYLVFSGLAIPCPFVLCNFCRSLYIKEPPMDPVNKNENMFADVVSVVLAQLELKLQNQNVRSKSKKNRIMS